MRPVAIAALDAEPGSLRLADSEFAEITGIAPEDVARWSKGRARWETPDGEGPAALAARAGRRILEAAGLAPADVDFLVFSTTTPDMFFPGSACLLQHALGCRTVGGLDVRLQCTGFLAALDTARRFVATARYDRVLVAAAETWSHVLARDARSPHLTAGCGDAAAVALLQASDRGEDVLGVTLTSDGSRAEDFWCEFPASRFREGSAIAQRNRLPAHKVAEGGHFPRADFERMREWALARVPAIVQRCFDGAGIERVDAALVAHVDGQTEAMLAEAMAARAARVSVPDFLYAGSASLPVALAIAKSRGEVVTGETVALVTAGAGASAGCAIVRVP